MLRWLPMSESQLLAASKKGSSEAHTKLVRDIQLACSNGDIRLFINTNGLFYRDNGHTCESGSVYRRGDLIGWESNFTGNSASRAL